MDACGRFDQSRSTQKAAQKIVDLRLDLWDCDRPKRPKGGQKRPRRQCFPSATVAGRSASTSVVAAISKKCRILRVFVSFVVKVCWPLYRSRKKTRKNFFLDRCNGRSTCTKRSLFRRLHRPRKSCFVRPTLWTVDFREKLSFDLTEAQIGFQRSPREARSVGL